MLDGLRARWRRLKSGQPGARFQRQYRENRESRKSGLQRWGADAAGAGLSLVGILLLFIPGPGLLFIAAGGAVLARESQLLARALDWSEVRGRRLWRRVRREPKNRTEPRP
jgi:hypothetical protein